MGILFFLLVTFAQAREYLVYDKDSFPGPFFRFSQPHESKSKTLRAGDVLVFELPSRNKVKFEVIRFINNGNTTQIYEVSQLTESTSMPISFWQRWIRKKPFQLDSKFALRIPLIPFDLPPSGDWQGLQQVPRFMRYFHFSQKVLNDESVPIVRTLASLPESEWYQLEDLKFPGFIPVELIDPAFSLEDYLLKGLPDLGEKIEVADIEKQLIIFALKSNRVAAGHDMYPGQLVWNRKDGSFVLVDCGKSVEIKNNQRAHGNLVIQMLGNFAVLAEKNVAAKLRMISLSKSVQEHLSLFNRPYLETVNQVGNEHNHTGDSTIPYGCPEKLFEESSHILH